MVSIKSAINTILTRRSESATILLRKIREAFIVNVAGTALAFGLQVLLARMLGVASFGQYVYALTWINLCVLVAKLGFDTAALRFIPEYQAQERWGLLRGFIQLSKQATLTISILMAGLVAAVVVLLDSRINTTLREVFLLACILLPANAYLIVQGAHLQGFKHIVAAQAPQVILRPLLLAISLVAISMFITINNSAAIAMLMTVSASCVAIFIMAKLSQSMLPQELKFHEPEYMSMHWGKVALSMMFITSFTMVLNQTDLIMVGAMMSTADAGIYSAASRVATFLTFGITLVNSIAAPMMSQLYAQGKIAQLQRMLSVVAWGSFAFATPLCLGVMVFGENIMHLFGAEFVAGSDALVILAVSRWIIALTGAAGYLMSMSGHERQAAWILGFSALLNLALNALLIAPFGIKGAAIATLVTTGLWSALMVFYGRKYIGVNSSLSLRFS